MTTVALIAAIAAALACPAHMLWRLRRGGRARCIVLPTRDTEELRHRKAELEARIEAAEREPRAGSTPP